MTKVLSLINMKGGVGKTTLAMQLACAAASKNLRTLAVGNCSPPGAVLSVQ